MNIALEREVGGKVVRIEWQLTSPFNADADAEGGEEHLDEEATDFCLSVEDKSSGAGVMFYCSTQTGEDTPRVALALGAPCLVSSSGTGAQLGAL